MENWKDVPGYVGFYQVSDQGNVASLQRLLPSATAQGIRRVKTILKFGQNNQGRRQVSLCAYGEIRRFQVNRLVLEAFVGPCPAGLECRHLNGDHTDNRLENLVWGTREENREDARRHGTEARGEAMPQAKLTEADVRAIRASAEDQATLAKRYGVSQVTVSHIRNRRTWKHVV